MPDVEALRVWKMDYPVMREERVPEDPITLRIWCDLDGQYRPYGAARVTRILGPTIERWVTSGLFPRVSREVAPAGLVDVAGRTMENGDRQLSLTLMR